MMKMNKASEAEKSITREYIISKLESLNKSEILKGYRVGLAGSYARGTYSIKSDVDIVVDTDMLTFEQIDYIKSMFSIKVDVIHLQLLKDEDERLDKFSLEHNLPINEFSAYKEICKEVVWCG